MNLILIDTDPGIDDAIALVMALAAPAVEVRAITVTSGNCAVDQGVHNALGIVELMDAVSVPVARGADLPLSGAYKGAGAEVHGTNGIGGAEFRSFAASVHPVPGERMIVDQVLRAQGQLTIVALAPLTNLAKAIRLWPGIVGAVRKVIIMGGAFAVQGNATQYAECNMFNDPVAARVVLSSGIPVTLIPLDVTRSAIVDANVFTAVLQEFADNPLASFLMGATKSYFKSRSPMDPHRTAVLHDPLALAIALQPSLARYEQRRILIEIAGDNVGQTRMLDADAYEDGGATVEVATRLDASCFIQLTVSLLRRAVSRKAQCL